MARILICFIRPSSKILVLNPITSLQAYFKFNSGKKPWGSYAPPETDYLALGDLLTRKLHHDFTFLHPETWVSSQCKLVKERIELGNKVNHQSYQWLIIPGGKVISVAVLQKVKKWVEQGGKVIATTMLPSQSAEFGKDLEVISVVKALFGIDPTGSMPATRGKVGVNSKGGKSCFVPQPDAANLSATMEQMGLVPDLVFESLPGLSDDKTEVSYIHKVKENRNIWYIANSSDTPVKTNVELRGNLNLELWYPENGKTEMVHHPVTVKHGEVLYTSFLLDLPAIRSVFVVEK